MRSSKPLKLLPVPPKSSGSDRGAIPLTTLPHELASDSPLKLAEFNAREEPLCCGVLALGDRTPLRVRLLTHTHTHQPKAYCLGKVWQPWL